MNGAQLERAASEQETVRDFTGYAYAIASEFFHPSLDLADLRQEALIGVVKAHREFNPELGMSFRSFCALVVRRHVISAVKAAGRLKQRALTEAVRIATNEDGDTVAAVDSIPDPVGLDHRVECRERLRLAMDVLWDLSPLEMHAAVGLANGISARELGRTVGVDRKSIDNANQRAHRKFAEAA